MNYRAASRAVSRIATPSKPCILHLLSIEKAGASRPFRDRTCSRVAWEHVHSMGAGCGVFTSRPRPPASRGQAFRPRASESGIN
jgi:hypothetical protein